MGGLGSNGKQGSLYRPGLSPYTAKQEELIVFAAFNYTPSTVHALGQSAFMPSDVVGAVNNPEVQAALQRTLGLDVPAPAPLAAPRAAPSSAHVALAAAAALLCALAWGLRRASRAGRRGAGWTQRQRQGSKTMAMAGV